MRNCSSARSSLLGRIAIFLLALPVVILACAAAALAQGQVQRLLPAPPAASPSAETLHSWHKGMVQVPPPNVTTPNGGCFTATYPNAQWQEVPCAQGVTPPPFPPVPGRSAPDGAAFTVGGGTDPVPGVTSGHISTAVGSFDSVSGVTSVMTGTTADDYSLQLNVNTFSSAVCSGAANPAKCVGWQQFIFSNGQCTSGNVMVACTFMQYWLIGWGKTICPSGWTFYLNGTDDECYTNSNILVPPTQTIPNLGNLSVTGQAVSGGFDTVIFSSGATLYAVQNADSQLSLANGWTAAEYNLVGDCCGYAATLNSGSSMIVRISVDNGSTTSAPVCVSGSFGGYTAETNNLNLQPASGTPRSSTQPAMVWTQNSNSSSTAPCSAGVAVPAASKLVDTHDSNGDGLSDIVWRNGTGIAVWLMNGTQVELAAAAGSAPSAWSIVGQRDFNGDGTYDLLFRDSGGNIAMWFMIGTQVFSAGNVGNVGGTWGVAGTADFNGDGKGDILWRDGSGNTAVWLMNGTSVLSSGSLGNVAIAWSVAGTGDFNGNGDADILWRDTSGNTAIWFMNGTAVASVGVVGNVANWSVIGTGDFNGDGKTDILWRDASGNTAVWLMNGASVLSAAGIGNVPTTWTLAVTGDFNGDGKSDLLWRDGSGDTAIWFMNGTSVASSQSVGNISASWVVQGTNAN